MTRSSSSFVFYSLGHRRHCNWRRFAKSTTFTSVPCRICFSRVMLSGKLRPSPIYFLFTYWRLQDPPINPLPCHGCVGSRWMGFCFEMIYVLSLTIRRWVWVWVYGVRCFFCCSHVLLWPWWMVSLRVIIRCKLKYNKDGYTCYRSWIIFWYE